VDRVELSKKKIKEISGEAGFSAIEPENDYSMALQDDPDLYGIATRFIFGEIYYRDQLNEKQRELITLVVLTTTQNLPHLKMHVAVALNIGLTPIEVKEAVYQCAPYVGFPKTFEAINQVNKVLKKKKISLPLESQQQVPENNRYDMGLKTQTSLFGDAIDKMYGSTPGNQKHINNYLSAYCFGDFYTRGGLDLKTRELLTLCILAALGGCENQLKGHVRANFGAGNSKEVIIAAVTQCLPYIGFPRTLNALSCVNEIIPENTV